jgi:hypothetical protein
MALGKCSECGGALSSKAKICPHCGADRKSGIGCGTVILILIGLIFISNAFTGTEKNETGKIAKVEKQKTDAELREERLAKSFSIWDGAHIGLERYIKDRLNDPESYEHGETTYSDKGDHLIIRTEFRGKNIFGGTVSHWVIAKADLDGNIIGIIDESNWR